LLLVFALTCFAIALAVSAQQASSASYSTCHLSSKEKGSTTPSTLGPTYVRSVRVKGGVSCAYGKSFVKSYYNCRTGGSKPATGHCSGVRGYSCSESRPSSTNTSISFDARATCTKGSKGIKHTYEQFK